MKKYGNEPPIEEKWDTSSLTEALNYEDEEEYIFKGKRSKKNTNHRQKKPKWQ